MRTLPTINLGESFEKKWTPFTIWAIVYSMCSMPRKDREATYKVGEVMFPAMNPLAYAQGDIQTV